MAGAQKRAARARRSSSAASVVLERGRLRIGTARIPLIAGGIHYFRLAPDRWSDALRALRGLGASFVQTPVPWSLHDEMGFGGAGEPYDLGAFLDAAASEGLRAILHLGPLVGAELAHDGIPERVVHDRACQVLSPRQNPVIALGPPRMHPIVDLGSPRLLDELRGFFRELATVIEPRLAPRGPVALFVLGHGIAFVERSSPYDRDYGPRAQKSFAAFVGERVRDLRGGAPSQPPPPEGFLAPPTRFDAEGLEDLPPHLEWARFQEVDHLRTAVQHRSVLRDVGLDAIPVLYGVPPGEVGLPCDPVALRQVFDGVGFAFRTPPGATATTRRRATHLARLDASAFAHSIAVGGAPWHPPRSHEASIREALLTLAYGARGIGLDPLVERDRWYGAPIDRDGLPHVEAGTYRRLLRAIEATGFADLERAVDLLLLVPPELRRLLRITASPALPRPPSLETIGRSPSEPCIGEAHLGASHVRAAWTALETVAEAAASSGLAVAYHPTDLPLAEPSLPAAAFAPCVGAMSATLVGLLGQLASRGVDVFVGPALPTTDFAGAHLSRPIDPRAQLVEASHEARLVQWVRGKPAFFMGPTGVELSLHQNAEGPRVLFLIDRADERRSVQITSAEGVTLVDLLSGERSGPSNSHAFDLGAGDVRMLDIVRTATTGAERRAARPGARARRGSVA